MLQTNAKKLGIDSPPGTSPTARPKSLSNGDVRIGNRVINRRANPTNTKILQGLQTMTSKGAANIVATTAISEAVTNIMAGLNVTPRAEKTKTFRLKEEATSAELIENPNIADALIKNSGTLSATLGKSTKSFPERSDPFHEADSSTVRIESIAKISLARTKQAEIATKLVSDLCMVNLSIKYNSTSKYFQPTESTSRRSTTTKKRSKTVRTVISTNGKSRKNGKR
jgi:hypothetical protein